MSALLNSTEQALTSAYEKYEKVVQKISSIFVDETQSQSTDTKKDPK